MNEKSDELRWGALIVGLATAGLIGWLYLANALWRVPFVPLAITDLIIRLTPGAIATAGIETLGPWAQRLLKLIGFTLMIGLGAWSARDPKGFRKPLGSALLLAGAAFLATVLVELALSRGPALIGLRGAILAASLLAWAWTVVWGTGRAAASKQSSTTEELASEHTPLPAITSRRRFLAQFSAAALTLAGGGYLLGERLRPRPVATALPPLPTATPSAVAPALTAPPASAAGAPAVLATPPPGTPFPAFLTAPGTRPNITPLDKFYVVDIAALKPAPEIGAWRLQVKGLVNTPLALTFNDLLALPRTDLYGTLQCISNEVGGDLIGTTLFSGVRLQDVLTQAGPHAGIGEVVFRSLDGYAESIPWDKALRDDTLLIYGMDGKTLTQEHGYPLRLFNPNHFGMKNPKWLAEIELIGGEFTGYWVQRGWDREAIVKTSAVTDAGGKLPGANDVAQLGGIAFAGWRGIQEVGVRLDDGEFQPAVLDQPLSPFTWVRWRYDWPNPTPGAHAVTVRAVDGNGEEQTPFVMGPHPEGASGWHKIRVSV